jgi:hypothetical protein
MNPFGKMLLVFVLVLLLFSLPGCHPKKIESDPNVTLTPLAHADFPATTTWLDSGNGVPQGLRVQTDKGFSVVFMNGKEFLFDSVGTVIKGENADAFVTFTPLGGEVAIDWELSFYDSTGKLQSRDDKTHGHSNLTLSDNGETVFIAGTIKQYVGDTYKETVGYTIYNSAGEKIFQRIFKKDLITTAIAVNAHGQRIAYATQTHTRSAKTRFRLQIEKVNGEKVWSSDFHRPIQSLRFSDDDKILMVLGLGGVQLIELGAEAQASELYKIPDGYRVPGAGRIQVKSNHIFLVGEKPIRQRKGWNQWDLFKIDRKSGKSEKIKDGTKVLNRHSPALSLSPAFGAVDRPVLVTPTKITKFD